RKESSLPKKFQEELTANVLLKTNISSITEQDFKTILIKLIAGLKKNIEDIKETMATNNMENKNRHDELKNAINEIHNKLEVSNAWIENANKRISDLEYTIIEKQEADQKRDKMIQEHERRSRELSDTVKCNNIHTIRIPEEEKRGKGAEGVLEYIIRENFPTWGKK
ncbi:LITD1 protein, partial [Crocuta crocuta]